MFWLWNNDLQKKEYINIKKISIKQTLNSVCSKKMLISLVFMFAMGITDFYYSAFLMILLVFVSICVAINKKQIRQLFFGFLHLVVLFLAVGMCLLPLMVNYINYGNYDSHFSNRTVGEFIYYSLNITQLLLPIQNHRIDFLSRLRQNYDSLFLVTENSMSSLGVILSIGLVISLIFVFCKINRSYVSSKIKILGKLNLFLILLSISGGFSFFIGMFLTASVRCYNRTVVFIAFFSAISASIVLEIFVKKKSKNNFLTKKILAISMFVLGVVICVVDQIPQNVNNGSYYNPETGKYQTTIQNVESEYYRDRQFVQQIESMYEKEVKIFQYPIVTNYYSNIWPNGNIGAYDSMRPYLHSSGKSSWSYGAIVGDKTDFWLRNMEKRDIDEQLKIMSLFGFEGIYIDSDGYDSDELENLLKRIKKITKSNYITTDDQNLYFFNISDYAKKVNKDDKNQLLKKEYMIYYEFSDGFYPKEYSDDELRNWNWSINESKLIINNLYDEDIKVAIKFKINTLEEKFTGITLTINDFKETVDVNFKGRTCEINTILKPGNNSLNFFTDLENKKISTDDRELCFCVENLKVERDK